MIHFKIHNYFENIFEENINKEFGLKSIDETRNYFHEDIEQIKIDGWKGEKVLYNSKLYGTLSSFFI